MEKLPQSYTKADNRTLALTGLRRVMGKIINHLNWVDILDQIKKAQTNGISGYWNSSIRPVYEISEDLVDEYCIDKSKILTGSDIYVFRPSGPRLKKSFGGSDAAIILHKHRIEVQPTFRKDDELEHGFLLSTMVGDNDQPINGMYLSGDIQTDLTKVFLESSPYTSGSVVVAKDGKVRIVDFEETMNLFKDAREKPNALNDIEGIFPTTLVIEVDEKSNSELPKKYTGLRYDNDGFYRSLLINGIGHMEMRNGDMKTIIFSKGIDSKHTIDNVYFELASLRKLLGARRISIGLTELSGGNTRLINDPSYHGSTERYYEQKTYYGCPTQPRLIIKRSK